MGDSCLEYEEKTIIIDETNTCVLHRKEGYGNEIEGNPLGRAEIRRNKRELSSGNQTNRLHRVYIL